MKPIAAVRPLAAVFALAAGFALAAPPAARADVKAELLAQYDAAADKLNQLARAMPADKYGWRPGNGVRSVSEVFMHVAGGQYFLLSFAGIEAPKGTPKDLEKITDKAAVVEQLKTALDWARRKIAQAKPEDFAKAAKLPWRETDGLGVFMSSVSHLHEHLGQAIAYARSNGVVPPWSRQPDGSN
jgi:uncharacterized damage-inducible protein DinB